MERDKPKPQILFVQYLHAVHEKKEVEKTWRMGQTYFNVLREMRPDIAERIEVTDDDPFYDDGKIGAFLCKVMTRREDAGRA